MPSNPAADSSAPVDSKCMPQPRSAAQRSPLQPPRRVSRRSGPACKLDPTAKDKICLLVARGHSLAAAAHLVGVSDRTIYRERQRDPFFKQQLLETRAEIADCCFRSLRAAAPAKPQAATQLYKLVYPDRYFYRPGTLTVGQHEAWTTEVLGLFESIATPEQMRELRRRLSGNRKSQKMNESRLPSEP